MYIYIYKYIYRERERGRECLFVTLIFKSMVFLDNRLQA